MKSRFESIPSEHGDHMLILSVKKNKKVSKYEDLIASLVQDKPENKFDFALNTQINCDGVLSPNLIMDSQMPWQIDEDEQILQN
jgi:hypothetical protein